jgi:hypothetical protein
LVQAAGFLMRAGGIALTWSVWGDEASTSTAATGVMVALGGFGLNIFAKVANWLLHG